MAYNEENGAMRSHIPPPSRIPATPGRGLLEMSASANNVRAMMPPPQAAKHKVSGLPEPAPKRKTLAERAGEVNRPGVAPPTSRAVNGSVKAAVSAGVRPGTSFSSSSSRASSTTSRKVSTTSTQSSASSRPPSALSTSRRPQTALGHSRTKSVPHVTRPGTAGDEDDSSNEGSALPNKRKGMALISLASLQPQSGLRPPKQRERQDKPGYIISDLPDAPRARSQSPFRTPSISEKSFRNISLSSAFQNLSLGQNGLCTEVNTFPSIKEEPQCPKTPSQIPKYVFKAPSPKPCPSPHVKTPATRYKISVPSPNKVMYLTRNSNSLAPAWDTKGRLEDMELLYSQLKGQFEGAAYERTGLEEALALHKSRLNELEQARLQLSTTNQTLSIELLDVKSQLSSKSVALDDATRVHTFEMDDIRRKHRNEMEDFRDQQRREFERLHREARDESDRLRKEAQENLDALSKSKKEELQDLERALKAEVEEERSKRLREVQELTTQFALQRQTADLDVSQKDREIQTARNELSEIQGNLDRANALIANLQDKLAEASANTMSLETSMRAMKAKIDFLESDNQQQSQAFADLNQKMQDAVDSAAEAYEKLRAEETLRRKLHNQVQELKGNIRVFCRVRPTLDEEADDRAKIAFPDSEADCKEVAIQTEQKSAMGTVTTANNAFAFDRVFGPRSQNGEVFEEISQLVQSALDGYNVCIFCYGQTGSGKTYTMSSLDGMIPRAVNQIYETAKSLEEKGWTYKMEGSFIEVYNEMLNDLLGKAEDWEKKKHEIRHDPAKGKTTVTGVATVELDSPGRVTSILEKASRNRSVAATMANSRSSRSHSVFILKLTGENSITGERSEGTLNLVDLAGSERLSHSGATGDRMKETQHINKSLSCLGDVIGALGQGKDGGHVPYRNSKLTYLLQYSLGGNSKTLMFVMISPLQAHLSETITSLKFATKVHNTHIGTAKRQAKVKD